MANSAKILFLDIETAPNIAFVWGLWEQNIHHNQVVASSYILCWSAKWSGRGAMYFDSVLHHSHPQMLKRIHSLLDEADIIVHYNGLKFDIPTLNKEFVKHGFLPPAPYKQIDMLGVCRNAFRFESNKLASVVKSLDLKRKIEDHGFQLWVDCMDRKPDAWVKMERYNRNDVVILEQLYKRLLPWIKQHPTVRYDLNKLVCPKCGSGKTQRRGEAMTRVGSFHRHQCLACGGWFRGSKRAQKFRGEQGVNL